jgi:Holliday junction resolvase RusA-like endonuclease
MTFRLPWPPSVNSFLGKRYTPKQVIRFRAEAMGDIRRQIGDTAASGRVRIHLALTPPDDKEADSDNYLKATIDAIKRAGVIKDDSRKYVKSVTAEWTDDIDRAGPGCCDVTIEPVEG